MKYLMNKTVLVLLAFLLTSSAYAARVDVEGEAAHSGASAVISVDEDYLGEKTLGILSFDLKPYGVYTVWFVNQQPEMSMAGAGSAPYSFITNARGNGNYKSKVSAYDLDNRQMLKVVLHKDGDAKNMDMGNLKAAFAVNLSSLRGSSDSLASEADSYSAQRTESYSAPEAGSHGAPEAENYKAREATTY
jgi:hypothetical protein